MSVAPLRLGEEREYRTDRLQAGFAMTAQDDSAESDVTLSDVMPGVSFAPYDPDEEKLSTPRRRRPLRIRTQARREELRRRRQAAAQERARRATAYRTNGRCGHRTSGCRCRNPCFSPDSDVCHLHHPGDWVVVRRARKRSAKTKPPPKPKRVHVQARWKPAGTDPETRKRLNEYLAAHNRRRLRFLKEGGDL